MSDGMKRGLDAFPQGLGSRNLVRFCRHLPHEQLHESFAADFGFRAEFSRFSVLKNPGTLPGPDDCFAHIQQDARPFFSKLLGLEISYPGVKAGTLHPYSSTNYYRSHLEEFFHECGPQNRAFPPIEGRCVTWFAGTDVLRMTYELGNKSAAPVVLRLRWFSVPLPGRTSVGKRGFRHECFQKVSRSYRVTAEMSGAHFRRTGSRLRTAWLRAILAPHAKRAWTFTVKFNGAKGQPFSLHRAVANVERRLAALPKLKKEWRRFEPLVLRAAGILLSARYTELHGAGTIHGGKCGVEAVWFWDTATTLLGTGLLRDAPTGWSTVRVLCDGIKGDGEPFTRFCDGEYVKGTQNPILAWGVWNFHQLCPDTAQLRRAYPALKRYVNWWRRRGEGLVTYPSGCTGLDDALQWQTRFPIALRQGELWQRKDWGRSRPDLFHSVDINTQLYLEMRAMERMAGELGMRGEGWGTAAAALAGKIQAELWNPSAGVYQARSAVGGRFNGIVSLESFLPIYAGITPRKVARELCRRFLLDPRRFYTTLPFPTLDRRHEAFRSGGSLYESSRHPGALVQQAYWIGRTWLNYSYWMVGALWQAGLRREAEAATEKILEAVSRSETIYECYDPLTGTGNGHAEFPWAAASVLALAYGLYRRGPLF